MTLLYLLHSFFLAIAIVATYIWAKDPILSIYNLQLTGALVLLYFVFRMINTARRSLVSSTLASTIILTVISLLLVFSTGTITSPLFFILNFLLFVLALLFEPAQAATASIVLIGIFVLDNHTSMSSQGLINLVSLGAMTPLAIIFSRTYLKNLEAVGKIKILKQVIKQEEAESLLWVSTSAKPSIASVLNSVSDLVIYFNTISGDHPKALIEKLKAVQNDLISLYTSTGIFEKNIKDTSDNIDEK